MELQALMNSPILWALSSLMVLGVVGECIVFTIICFKHAAKLGVPKSEVVAGMRSAMITAIGPSLAPLITLIALMAVLGGPTGWMRMNDIGAARTELAMCAMAAEMAGSSLDASKITVAGFVFCLWGMALNNSGWIVVGGYGATSLNKAVEYMKNNFNAAWVKLVMAAAALGLFGTLLSNSVIAKSGMNTKNLAAAVIAYVTMTAVGMLFKGNKRIQEFSLGIAMLVGMFVTAAIF